MCGIIGMVAQQAVNQDLYDGLTILQHRGQDAAGIMTSDDRRVYLRKANGLVRDVIRNTHMLRLKGKLGIGHVRYPTAGSQSAQESQPFYVNSPYGLSLVHNGNLTNTAQLTDDLIKSDLRHLNTGSDSEVLLNVFAHELQNHSQQELTTQIVFDTIARVKQRIKGAYAVIVMIQNFGLVAFRDPHGIRPLVYGERHSDAGAEVMVASESIALDALGFESQGDVLPDESLVVTLDGKVHRQQCPTDEAYTPCIFEYIYLARPDSIIDGVSAYRARWNMGEKLAEKIMKEMPDHDIDVVIPIPDTSRTSAIPLANKLGLRYSEGFVKNRYIGRTFIMPGQSVRKKTVKMKLNPIAQEFAGKNVLLVDDSIVRGTTSKQIIQMARDAGAKKVYFASAAPEVRNPNVYGIDMASAKELIAHDRTAEQVAEIIGADALIYQDLSDVYDAVNEARNEGVAVFDRFEDSIFTGDYVTGDVDQAYLDAVEALRNDKNKTKHQDDAGMVEEV
ncbi:MAG: amidophosphoribosyltransferase [Coxiellaceae bacterium]|nr:amidophosphoribosyltransferase [Coxiellaceae bacterium]